MTLAATSFACLRFSSNRPERTPRSYITTPIRKPKFRKLLDWEKAWNRQVSSFRAPVERAIADLKAWRALFTDYRRPLGTFETSFHAATGLYFFKASFE